MRLGSEVQLGTSIATFSADGAGSFVLKESQQRENNACLACTGAQAPWLEVSTRHSLLVHSHHGCQHPRSSLCLQKNATLLKPSRGWHKGRACLGRQCTRLCSHGRSGSKWDPTPSPLPRIKRPRAVLSHPQPLQASCLGHKMDLLKGHIEVPGYLGI